MTSHVKEQTLEKNKIKEQKLEKNKNCSLSVYLCSITSYTFPTILITEALLFCDIFCDLL